MPSFRHLAHPSASLEQASFRDPKWLVNKSPSRTPDGPDQGFGAGALTALIAGPVLGYTVRGRKRDGRFHGGGRRTEDGDDLQRRVDVDIVSVLNVEFDQQAAQWYTELG